MARSDINSSSPAIGEVVQDLYSEGRKPASNVLGHAEYTGPIPSQHTAPVTTPKIAEKICPERSGATGARLRKTTNRSSLKDR